jgi:hypothetical protein
MLPRDALCTTTMSPSTREVRGLPYVQYVSTVCSCIASISWAQVLHDLTTARGLVDWRLHCVGDRDVVVGSALSARLQDNRLQRKRKHQSGAASGDVDAPPSLARSICSFVVVSTAREPTLSMERCRVETASLHDGNVMYDDKSVSILQPPGSPRGRQWCAHGWYEWLAAH